MSNAPIHECKSDSVRFSEFSQVEPEDFVASRARAAHRLIKIHDPNSGKVNSLVRAEFFLTPESAADLRRFDTKTFLNRRHDAGFAIAFDGKLRNLFATCGKGDGIRAAVQAIALGAVHLSAFGEWLVGFYSRLGWIEVDRVAFDPTCAPERWPYELIGTPAVVTMEFQRAIPLGLNERNTDDTSA